MPSKMKIEVHHNIKKKKNHSLRWSLKSRQCVIFFLIQVSRGVHQTAQTARTAPKPLAKWHNCIAPQVIVHYTA